MNLSDNNEILWKWNEMLVLSLIQNDLIIFCYLLFGVTGNFIVIYLYLSKMKRQMDNRYFIPYLAILDLLSCVFGSVTALAFNFHPVTFNSDVICKVLNFTGQWCVGSSGILLVVIAIHRYLKVCRPFGFQMTLPWKRAALCLSIVASAAYSVPTLVYYGKTPVVSEHLNITGYNCGKQIGMHGTGLLVYTIVILGMAVSCIMALSFLYCSIAKTIYKQRRKHGKHLKMKLQLKEQDFDASSAIDTDDVHSSTESSPRGSPLPSPDIARKQKGFNDISETDASGSSPKVTKKTKTKSALSEMIHKTHIKKYDLNLKQIKVHLMEKKYSWMFMVITVVFILAYLPWNIITLLETIDSEFWYKRTNSQVIGLLFLYRLFLLNHIANPFIYGLFDTPFRKEVRKLFICACQIKRLD